MVENFDNAACRDSGLAASIADKFYKDLQGHKGTNTTLTNARESIMQCAPTQAMDAAKQMPYRTTFYDIVHPDSQQDTLDTKAHLFQNTAARILAEQVADEILKRDPKHQLGVDKDRLTELLRPTIY